MARYSVTDSAGTEVKLRSPAVVSLMQLIRRWLEIIGRAHA